MKPGTTMVKSDNDHAEFAERFLQRRRRWVISVAAMTAIIIGLSLLDHLGAFGYRGNDWARFDKRSFQNVQVLTADELRIDGVVVRLIGVDPPHGESPGAAEAVQYTKARTAGRAVTLRLEPTLTRDSADRLLAYVYLSDEETLNLALIRDGQAFADRRVKHTFAGPFEQAEAEARNPKKPRGMWKDLPFDQQPAWRQEWVSERNKLREAATRPR